MKIEFYIPKDQTIPTNLRLKIDDKYDVHYQRGTPDFSWIFEFYGPNVEEKYIDLLNEIVKTMEYQSYDHGAEWIETKRTIFPFDKYSPPKVKVHFRIRDSY